MWKNHSVAGRTHCSYLVPRVFAGRDLSDITVSGPRRLRECTKERALNSSQKPRQTQAFKSAIQTSGKRTLGARWTLL